MNKPVFFFFLTCLLSMSMKAQENLVPNGSFEEYDSCPNNLGDFTCKYWFNPTFSTPDYYNICNTTGASVSSNLYGFQNPLNGRAYSGIVLNSTDGYREYLGIKMLDILKAGATYQISLYVSLSNTSNLSSNNLEVWFQNDTSNIFSVLNTSDLDLTDNNIQGFDTIIEDTLNWTFLTIDYLAKGGESFIILGNFNLQSNTIFANYPIGQILESYYYVDDVKVTEKPLFTLIPNIFSPNLDGVNDHFLIDGPPLTIFRVLNRWGEIVFESFDTSIWNGNNREAECSDGTYFYVYEYAINNKLEIKTGYIHLVR